MNFFKQRRVAITLLLSLIISISFIKCAHEASHLDFHTGVELDDMIHKVDDSNPQVTTLADALDSLPPEDRDVVRNKTFDRTFSRIAIEGVELLNNTIEEQPWDLLYEFFIDLGTIVEDPENPDRFKPFSNEIGSIVHVYSNNPRDKIRYLNAGFKPGETENGEPTIKEKHISFEVEKSEENMVETLAILKASLVGESTEPCFIAGVSWYFFKKDSWVIEVRKETTESIESKIENSFYPVRTMDDVGVVLVSISTGGHNPVIEGTNCLSDHDEEHDH